MRHMEWRTGAQRSAASSLAATWGGEQPLCPSASPPPASLIASSKPEKEEHHPTFEVTRCWGVRGEREGAGGAPSTDTSFWLFSC